MTVATVLYHIIVAASLGLRTLDAYACPPGRENILRIIQSVMKVL